MKIYVDELPKSCLECFANYDIIECMLNEKHESEMDSNDLVELKRCLCTVDCGRYGKCPLKLISERDKEVRAEERKKARLKLEKILEEEGFVLFEWLNILDQIEGGKQNENNRTN